MDLLDIKISEIKNINLIYLYNTDSVFTSEENRYLGIRVVYENNSKYMTLDFKDSHFSYLVKHLVSRYNQEKNNRNIILLGSLTEKLMCDEKILKITEEKQTFNSNGLTLFNTKKEKIKTFEPYLKEVLEQILKVVKQYEVVKIDTIDGYNNKYVINYSIGNVKKSFRALICLNDEENLSFKLGMIDNSNIFISGTIKNNLNFVEVNYNSSKNNLYGIYKFDVIKSEIVKKIVSNDITVFYDESGSTITTDDEELIKFYLNLFSVEWDGYFIKTGDYNFIFGHTKDLIEKEESILNENHGMQLYITDDTVRLRYKIKTGINKYQNRMNVELDYVQYDVILSKLNINDQNYVLAEKTTSNDFGKKYEYTVYKSDMNDFRKPFDYTKIINLENIMSLYDIKRKVLGGMK